MRKLLIIIIVSIVVTTILFIAIEAIIFFAFKIKNLMQQNKALKKDDAIKFINRMIAEEYSLKTIKGGLILEEMLYHYDNGCNTKESLRKVYPLVINKIVYFGKKVRK